MPPGQAQVPPGRPQMPPGRPQMPAGQGQKDLQLQRFKDIRRTSGLHRVPVTNVLDEVFTASKDGKLTYAQFAPVYKTLMQKHIAEGEMPHESMPGAVFGMFDERREATVDVMKLISGITTLCDGNEDEKIKATFDRFDKQNSQMTADDLFQFISSIFKVVLTPQIAVAMNAMGVGAVTPEDLAQTIVGECFKAVGLNHQNEKISVEQFVHWFNTSCENQPTPILGVFRRLLTEP